VAWGATLHDNTVVTLAVDHQGTETGFEPKVLSGGEAIGLTQLCTFPQRQRRAWICNACRPGALPASKKRGVER
jgi:hypothetical protein